MKKIFSIVAALCISGLAFAQDNVATMRDNARKEMQANNLDNAIEILKRAYGQEKENVAVQKDLALAYYYKKDFPNMLEIAKVLLAGADPDMQAYQLAGMAYSGLQDFKEGEKVLRTAIKEFPTSGPLYTDLGELLDLNKDSQGAINAWEKGIQVAPSYSGNYYSAAIYYFKQPAIADKIWAILYGEIYANMESLNPKSGPIKKMVMDGYQHVYANTDLEAEANRIQNDFIKSIASTFAKQKNVVAQGLNNPEALAMVRTKFVLDWFNNYDKKFPYKLFEYHRQLMQGGLFDAYNQWMFGPVANMDAFKNWAELNKPDYDKFTQFHTSRIFKVPQGQYYK